MQKTVLALGATAVLIVVAGLASAEPAPGGSPPSLTPEQIIMARKAALDMSVMTMAEMKSAVKNGASVKKQFYPASVLGRWARVLPTLFPRGTGEGATAIATNAKGEVWTDQAGFAKAAADYAQAADALAARASADDAPGFSEQLGVVAKACDACHDKYKERTL